MSTLVAEDELESTRGERFLAIVFALFLVIGLIWGYAKLDEPFRPPQSVVTDPAILARDAAQSASEKAQGALDLANLQLEQSREAYRTALDAGQPAAELERAYQQAQIAQRTAATTASEADQRLARARGPAEAASKRLEDERADEDSRARLLTFLVRVPYVLGLLGISFWLLARYRHRARRRLPLLYAGVAATTLLALVMAGDYITDYISLPDLGPLLISLTGVALSLIAFVALQRALVRRVPPRRVRRGECPFCGYPLRSGPDTAPAGYCEGCGRDVIGECTSCHRPRRVGTPHCGACGSV
ncbi:MAG: hypothetical protein JNL54_03910 [Kineosporiaceae bacterium]|nr:hypothetical protein [Kineosporiaceae bacterium]